jgi:hypothetical protein
MVNLEFTMIGETESVDAMNGEYRYNTANVTFETTPSAMSSVPTSDYYYKLEDGKYVISAY